MALTELTVLDIFSGIGGFTLGLERAGGFRTVAFCEIDPFCRALLRQRWPGVPIFGDVRTLTAEKAGPVDIICGGFPCQDISDAGQLQGIDGERSGLWKEFARLIGEIKPRWVLVENVSALLKRGMGRVLADLAALGFDAEWHCIPATFVGAPQRRDRIFIVAYPMCERHETRCRIVRAKAQAFSQEWSYVERCRGRPCPPGVLRMADGLPYEMDRIRGLGNAVVPDLVAAIGRAIVEAG